MADKGNDLIDSIDHRPLHESQIAENEANARRLNAAAERELAQRDYYAAQQRHEVACAVLAEYDVAAAARKERNELAKNEHYKVYVFDKEVSESSVKACISQLVLWSRQDPECAIEIQINSPGGSIFDGFALIDFIRDLRDKGHHVTIVVFGMAASMAGVILQAADTRVMGANALMLIHEGALGAMGDFGKVEDRVALMKLMHDRILDLFAERSNVNKAFIRKHWLRTDWWLTASDSLKHGFVDEIR